MIRFHSVCPAPSRETKFPLRVSALTDIASACLNVFYSWTGLHCLQYTPAEKWMMHSNKPTMTKTIWENWHLAQMMALGRVNPLVPLKWQCLKFSDFFPADRNSRIDYLKSGSTLNNKNHWVFGTRSVATGITPKIDNSNWKKEADKEEKVREIVSDHSLGPDYYYLKGWKNNFVKCSE